MPGTRTAPPVNGSPTIIRTTIRLVDFAGDRRSLALDNLAAFGVATDADIEAFVAAVQAATNASVYAVEVSQVYNSTFQASNALSAVYQSADDAIVVNLSDATKRYQALTLRSPLASLFTPAGSEDPDSSVAALANAVVAALDIVNGGSLAGTGTYTAKTVRFSEHSEINEAKPYT